MRTTSILAMALTASVVTSAAWAQTAPTATANAAPAAAAAAQPACANPNALGVSRVVQIDTESGPGFGFEHFKAYDFLREKEVVLTFDDGPWLGTTPAVLKALADQCTKAVFFNIGKHAGYYPEIVKQVVAQGHTVGTHTWSHKDLSKLSYEEAKAEIEKGIAAVSIAHGNKPVAPFFRFPALRHPPELVKYMAERHLAMFSTDFDSFDFKMRKADQVVKSVDGQAREARQGHHPDARLPEADGRSAAGDPRRAQEGRLQGRADDRQDAGRADRGIQAGRAQGDGRRTRRGEADVERDPDHPGQLSALHR